MSYGLRYIGRQNLTQRNFANFIQQHKLSSEYLRQGEIFVPAMREAIRRVRDSESFKVCRNSQFFVVYFLQTFKVFLGVFWLSEMNTLAATFG